MRALKIILTLFFVVFSGRTAISQDFGDNQALVQYTKVHSLIIKTQAYQMIYGSLPLTGEYGFMVERKIGLKSSFVGEAALIGNGLLYLSMLSDSVQDRITMGGVRVQLSYRFYLTKKESPEGLFIAPHISYATVKYSTVQQKALDNYLQVTHIDYSVIAGWQFIVGRFAFETFVGATYRDRKWVEKNSQSVKLLNQDEIEDMYIINSIIRPKFGFSVGFAL